MFCGRPRSGPLFELLSGMVDTDRDCLVVLLSREEALESPGPVPCLPKGGAGLVVGDWLWLALEELVPRLVLIVRLSIGFAGRWSDVDGVL